MSVRYIFPYHPYTAYSLEDIDDIGRRLPEDWSISATKTWKSRRVVVSVVEIWGPDGLWHIFTNPHKQWLVVTDDGIPFDFFESKTDLEAAMQELANFKTGRVTLTDTCTAIQRAGKN